MEEAALPVEALGRQSCWGGAAGSSEDTLSSHPGEGVWWWETPGPGVRALQGHHTAHGLCLPRGAAGISGILGISGISTGMEPSSSAGGLPCTAHPLQPALGCFGTLLLPWISLPPSHPALITAILMFLLHRGLERSN